MVTVTDLFWLNTIIFYNCLKIISIVVFIESDGLGSNPARALDFSILGMLKFDVVLFPESLQL